MNNYYCYRSALSTLVLCLSSLLSTQGQTTIYVDKKSMFLYWNNLYKERIPPYVKENKKADTLLIDNDKYPIRLIANDKKPNTTFGKSTTFVLYPNEVVSASKNKNGYTQFYSNSDNLRNNELNFFAEMGEILGDYEGFKVGQFPDNLPAEERIRRAEDLYTKRIKFLENYMRKSPISPRFEEYLQTCFFYSKLATIAAPAYDILDGSKKGIDPLLVEKLHKEYTPKDDYFYLTEYNEASFLYAASLTGTAQPVPPAPLIHMFATASTALQGSTRDVVLFNLLRLVSEQQPDSLATLAARYMNLSQTSQLTEYVQENYQLKAAKRTQNRMDSSGTSPLIPAGSESITTWQALTSSAIEPLTYVDFWASWCGPCRAEMPNSDQLRRDYVGKGVRFLYVSIDEQPGAWKRAIKQLGLPDSMNYLLVEGNKSILASELKLMSIPRYMLIGQGGKIISANAPRPGDPRVRTLLDKLLMKSPEKP